MTAKKIFLMLLFSFFSNVYAKSNQALVLSIASTIGPAEQHYIERAIKQAQRHDDNIIIIRLNSNGGSLRAIRRINELFLLTPVPMITYVAPSGASVSNESLSLIYASHLTAMAPQTKIGITDEWVETDDEIITKVQKNSKFSSYLGSLAYLRGRNADWAKKTVNDIELLTEKSAYEKKVIDEIAIDLDDLLQKLDGHRVRLNGILEELSTKALKLTYFQPDLQYRMLRILTDPTFIYALLFISVYAMIFEFTSPVHLSFILFVISLGTFLFAFYLMHFWRMHYFGLIFILIGILLALIGKTSLFSLMWKIPGLSLFTIGSYLLFIKTPHTLHPALIAITTSILIADMLLKINKKPHHGE